MPKIKIKNRGDESTDQEQDPQNDEASRPSKYRPYLNRAWLQVCCSCAYSFTRFLKLMIACLK